MKKEILSKGITCVLAIFMLVVTVFANTDLLAATKTSIGWKQYDSNIAVNDTLNVMIYNKSKKATYTYKSNKTSVAKVDKKGRVTGVGVGTAKITVIQTLNKKTKKIGSLSVTVKRAELAEHFVYCPQEYTNQKGYYESEPDTALQKLMAEGELLIYKNKKASYKFYSSDPEKIKITTDGVVTAVNGADGDALEILVKETYKKKTVTVAKIKANIKAPTYIGEDEITLAIGEKWEYSSYMQQCESYYVALSKDDNFKVSTDAKWENNTTYHEGDVLKFIEYELEYGFFEPVVNVNPQMALEAMEEGTTYAYFYLYDFQTKTFDSNPFKKVKIHVVDSQETTDI